MFRARTSYATRIVIMTAMILPVVTAAGDKQPDDYGLRICTLSSAGGIGSGNDLILYATVGQPSPIGTGVYDQRVLISGYLARASREGILVAVPDVPPLETRLYPAAPNPFNPRTTLAFDLARPGHVTLEIFDLKGRRICRLLDEDVGVGRFEIQWRGRDDHGRQMASGTYICRMQTAEYGHVVKLLLVK